MKSFSDRLKQIQTERGLTQAELAELMDVAMGSISSYMLGKKSPSLDTVEKMAKRLGVSIGYLVGENEEASEATTKYDLSKLIDKVFRLSRHANEKCGHRARIEIDYDNGKKVIKTYIEDSDIYDFYDKVKALDRATKGVVDDQTRYDLIEALRDKMLKGKLLEGVKNPVVTQDLIIVEGQDDTDDLPF